MQNFAQQHGLEYEDENASAESPSQNGDHGIENDLENLQLLPAVEGAQETPERVPTVSNELQLVPFQAGQVKPNRIPTVSDELQDLCDIAIDDSMNVTWDLYRTTQRRELVLKIRMALFPESVKLKPCNKEVLFD